MHALPRVTLPDVDPAQGEEAARLMELGRLERAVQIRARLIRSISLAKMGKHIYGGTVRANVKARRRARGKVAKASRKINRP